MELDKDSIKKIFRAKDIRAYDVEIDEEFKTIDVYIDVNDQRTYSLEQVINIANNVKDIRDIMINEYHIIEDMRFGTLSDGSWRIIINF